MPLKSPTKFKLPASTCCLTVSSKKSVIIIDSERVIFFGVTLAALGVIFVAKNICCWFKNPAGLSSGSGVVIKLGIFKIFHLPKIPSLYSNSPVQIWSSSSSVRSNKVEYPYLEANLDLNCVNVSSTVDLSSLICVSVSSKLSKSEYGITLILGSRLWILFANSVNNSGVRFSELTPITLSPFSNSFPLKPKPIKGQFNSFLNKLFDSAVLFVVPKVRSSINSEKLFILIHFLFPIFPKRLNLNVGYSVSSPFKVSA